MLCEVFSCIWLFACYSSVSVCCVKCFVYVTIRMLQQCVCVLREVFWCIWVFACYSSVSVCCVFCVCDYMHLPAVCQCAVWSVFVYLFMCNSSVSECYVKCFRVTICMLQQCVSVLCEVFSCVWLFACYSSVSVCCVKCFHVYDYLHVIAVCQCVVKGFHVCDYLHVTAVCQCAVWSVFVYLSICML